MKAAIPKVLDSLIRLVVSNDAELLRSVAAKALVELRFSDPRIPAALIDAILALNDDDYAKHIAWDLGE